MLEVVLEMCGANGVDDVHLIIANSLHRKMTAWEMERMVGSKIFKAYYPDRYYNHDAEDDDNLVTLGHTRHNEPLRVNKRAIESDLLIYLNINLVPMDGGHKSVAVGLCDSGLEFDSPDGQPTHVLFLLLTPQKDPSVQLELSANIAQIFRDPHALERVQRAQTFTEFLAAMKMLEPHARA